MVGAVTGLNEDGTPKMTDVKSAKLSDLVKFSQGQNPRSLHVELRAPVQEPPRHWILPRTR